VIVKDPTTPQTRRYTTLRNLVSFRNSELLQSAYSEADHSLGRDGQGISSLPLKWLVKEF